MFLTPYNSNSHALTTTPQNNNFQPAKLNINDLYRTINDKKEKRNLSFNHVLGKIHKKIKRVAEQERYNIYYDVPEYVFGTPLYDLNDCISYVIKMLRGNGFLVKYYFPRCLYISWDSIEITEFKKQKREMALNFRDKMDAQRAQQDTLQNPDNYYNIKNIKKHPYMMMKEGQSQKKVINTEIENPAPKMSANYRPSHLQPQSTQHSISVFKPILQYDPLNIPTMNYYAYSTMNRNLVDEKFVIEEPEEKYKEPENFKQLQIEEIMKQRELELTKIQEKQDLLYLKDVEDYYGKIDEDKPSQIKKDLIKEREVKNIKKGLDVIDNYYNHPFKNAINKVKNNGKFTMNLNDL